MPARVRQILPLPKVAHVNLTAVRQTVEGFGWVSFGIANVSDVAFDSLYLNDAPGDPYEMGVSIHRVIVPWNVSMEDELAYAQKTSARGARVIAAVLTPPPEMKTNNNQSGGSLMTDKYEAYAAYLKNISDYYSSNNVSLYAISVANTPDVASYKNVSWQYCSWTAQQLLDFVKNYGDKCGTKVYVAESWAFDQNLTNPILNDASAASKVAFIGGQQYAGNVAPYPLAQQQGKSVWHTEGPTANGDDTDIANVLVTAKDVHDSLTLGSHNAYVTFEMMVGPDGPTVRGFAYGQFAKYVRPGFERVDAPYSPATNVYMSAYTGGNGTVVLVVLNMNTQPVTQQFSLSGMGAGHNTFTPYYTHTAGFTQGPPVVAAPNGALTYTLHAQSVTTLVSN